MILNSPYITGSITVTGNANVQGTLTVTGSLSGTATSASLALNSNLLQGTGSVGFSTTASLLEVSSSQQQISASLLNVIANYATTGSNSFRADQSITGSLVVSSTITAQTLVVQTVTSSIVYSSGSNVFGNQLANTQTFTGSVNITGSITQIGANTTSSFGGSVGIGTISPQAKMHILNSTVGGSYFGQLIVEENGEAALQLKATNYSSIYFSDASSPYQAGITYVHSNDTMQFRASGNTTAMVITSGSNVGIGTITPTSSFNVVKSDNTTAAIGSFTANNLSQQTDIWYGGIRMGGTNANVDLNLASKGTGIVSISGSTTFTSNSTNPINYYSTDTSGEGLKIQWQSAYGPNRITGDMRSNASGAGGAFIIRVADTSATLQERLNISNTGITTITGPDGVLVLQAATVNKSLYVEYKNSVATRRGYVGFGGDSSSAFDISNNEAGDMVFRVNAGTERMRIKSGGYIDLNNVVYNDTATSPRTLYIQSSGGIGGISSIRASKKNIENISNINWLYQLNPVTFNYRKKDTEGNYTEEIYDEITYGLIAEDTQPIAEFLINYDDSNSDKKMIGIEYMKLITPMLKAIQELKATNDSLQAQINELKER